MSYSGVNKREHERFDLAFPATIECSTDKTKQKLHTRDISAGGVFFTTSQALNLGMKVKIEIILSNDALKRLTGYESCVKVQGTVVRSGPDGMAVSFDGEETIMPVQSAMEH